MRSRVYRSFGFVGWGLADRIRPNRKIEGGTSAHSCKLLTNLQGLTWALKSSSGGGCCHGSSRDARNAFVKSLRSEGATGAVELTGIEAQP